MTLNTTLKLILRCCPARTRHLPTGAADRTLTDIELYDVYQTKGAACDKQIEAILKRLKKNAAPPGEQAAASQAKEKPAERTHLRRARGTPCDPRGRPHPDRRSWTLFRAEASRGVRDQPGGLANSEAFHVVVGARPSQQGFRRKAAVIKDAAHQQSGPLSLRLAAVSVGRTDTALGAFYRRLSARAGKAKAITATARKIAIVGLDCLEGGC
jgi:transposase